MFIIGIDPHRGSHAAVVIDREGTRPGDARAPGQPPSTTTAAGVGSGYTPRAWAIEGATGKGSLLAQQLDHGW